MSMHSKSPIIIIFAARRSPYRKRNWGHKRGNIVEYSEPNIPLIKEIDIMTRASTVLPIYHAGSITVRAYVCVRMSLSLPLIDDTHPLEDYLFPELIATLSGYYSLPFASEPRGSHVVRSYRR